jgi:hypothetical protein
MDDDKVKFLQTMEKEVVSSKSTINEFSHLLNLDTTFSASRGTKKHKYIIPYSPLLVEYGPGYRRQ